MFLANMKMGRSKNRQEPQGPGKTGSRNHTCPLHLNLCHAWSWPLGPSHSVQAGAGRASVSERPWGPVLFLGLLCCFLVPPFKAQSFV